jgi:nitrile hydratase beta subunit
MDTVHDLGGRQGFGRVRWKKDRDEKAFREEWQGRGFALCMCMIAKWRGKPEVCTLDWFRHVRERIEPIDYLTRDYFDQWVQSLAATLIENGTIKLAELVPNAVRCGTTNPSDLASSKSVPAGFPARKTLGAQSNAPLFAAGDKVRMKTHIAAAHTRLPAYVRGRAGVIDGSHGLRPLADAMACGVVKPEPLYTVGFEAAELWPEAQGRRDRVYVDAWESYLERT